MVANQISREWMVMVLCGFFVGCGGDDPERPEPIPFEEDQEDAGHVDDVEDVEEDVEEPWDPDSGPVDGVGDNCPELSNPDQADRDRDGVGDACDFFPFYYRPSNPEQIDIVQESQGLPNSSAFEARQNWLLELPFSVEGALTEVGEIDYYAFDIEEPTNILVHVESKSASIWPGLIIAGDSASNEGYQAVVLGDGNGEDALRDVHLPLPGRYFVAISDFRNLSNQGAVGGPGYEYQLSLSTPPLPEGEVLSLPTPRKVIPYQGEPIVFSMDMEGEDALRVQASGSPENQNSVILPAIHFMDGDSGEMLAYTVEPQVDTTTLRNELTLKLSEEVKSVDVLIQAHTAIGTNNVIVDLTTEEQPGDLESFEDPRDSRQDHLLWLGRGTTVEASIGAPRVVSETSLAADVDYFLLYGRPGQQLQVTVEPRQNGLMIPEVEVGTVWLSSGFEFFSSWHRSLGATETGDMGVLSALISAENQGEVVIRVRQSGNVFSSLPVGGPKYEYDLRVDEVEIPEQVVAELPATVPVILEAGEQGLYEIPFVAGNQYRVEYNGGFSRRLEMIDRGSWQVVESATGSFTFLPAAGREYLVAIRGSNGQAITADQNIVMMIDEVAVDAAEVVAPYSEFGEIDADAAGVWWKVAVEPNRQYAVNVVGELVGGALEFDIFDSDSLDEIMTGSQGFGVFNSGGSDELFVNVKSGVDVGAVDFGFSIGAVEAVSLSGAAVETVELVDGIEPHFFLLEDVGGGLATMRVEGTGTSWSQLLEESYVEVAEEQSGALVARAQVSSANLLGAVIPRGLDGAGWMADVEVSTIDADEAVVLDTDDGVESSMVVEEWPASFRGTLVFGEDRSFEMDLNEGDTIWVLAMADGDTEPTDVDPDLDLYRPDESRFGFDWTSGEGNFPAMERIEIDETGLWKAELRLWSSSSDPGDFVIYFLRE